MVNPGSQISMSDMERKSESNSKIIIHRLICIITILPLVVTVFLLPFTSSKVPLHYDALGNINRWGSKYELLLFPIVIIAFGYFISTMINLSYRYLGKTKVEKILRTIIITISVLAIILVDYNCLRFLYKVFSRENWDLCHLQTYANKNIIW